MANIVIDKIYFIGVFCTYRRGGGVKKPDTGEATCSERIAKSMVLINYKTVKTSKYKQVIQTYLLEGNLVPRAFCHSGPVLI